MFRTLLVAVVDLILPRHCVGCGTPGWALCRQCLPARPVLVPDEPVPGVPVVAGAAYAGGLRRAVLAFKERGRRDLGGALGAILGRAVLHLAGPQPAGPHPTGRDRAGGLVLVPVPSSPGAAAERGGDHVLRLARRAAVVSGVRVAPGVLRLQRPVADSAGLGRVDRERNLHGALRARAPDPRGPVRVVVVDDIVTTGATLREAARALRRAGWTVVGAAVVATTERHAVVADPVAAEPRSHLASPLAAPRGSV